MARLGRRPLSVRRPLASQDIEALLAALETLGVTVEPGEELLELTPGELPASGEIGCGASGTMARFLTAALTTVPGTWRLDGTDRFSILFDHKALHVLIRDIGIFR